MVSPRRLSALAAVALAALTGFAHAQVDTRLVERNAGPRQIALGFPPPLPVASLTPVAGFRSQASLHARQQDLALRSPDLRAQVVGRTGKNREIWAYVLGPSDGLNASGQPVPAMLINATIHAREWQAPEVATGILERFTAGADDSGLTRFLLDEVQTTVIPVLNLDGFLMTQAHADRVYIGSDPGNATWPREGRMRRKNLRQADEVFETTVDHLQGVDLNRNFEPFYASNTSSSADLRHLTFHGPTVRSEPESQALVAAAGMIRQGRLRLFSDLHSFGRVLFSVHTGDSRMDNQTNLIAARIAQHHAAISISPNAPGGRFYANTPNPPGTGIGTTSEYFAYTYLIPAWTMELEPGNMGASEYGASGWHHDGFVLPASEIERLRTTMAESHVMLAYHVAGPAILKRVRVIDRDTGAQVLASDWILQADGRRSRSSRSLAPLRSGGRYRLWLGFDRPMRVAGSDGNAQLLPGQIGAREPVVSVRIGTDVAAGSLSNGRWVLQPGPGTGEVFDRYRGDAWVTDLDLPVFAAGDRGLNLSVDTVDAIGRNLDANPVTVADWLDGAWSGYENSSGVAGDIGGSDGNQVFSATGPLWFGAESATRIGEGELASVVIEHSATSAVTMQVQYGGGLTGPATLVLNGNRTVLPVALPDDLQLNPDRSVSLSVQAAGQPPLVLSLPVRDNDLAGERHFIARTPQQLATALDPAARALPRVISLVAGESYLLQNAAAAETWLPEIRGEVRIEGQSAVLRADPGRRIFAVAADGQLRLQELVLSGGGSADVDGGQISSAGSLRLSLVRSIDGQGRCGVVHSSGSLLAERSSVLRARGVSGGAFCISGGAAIIQSSSVIEPVAGSGALIRNSGQTRLSGLSVLTAPAQGAVLEQVAGSLTLVGSVISGAQALLCQGGVRSEGDNLLSPAACVSGNSDLVTGESLLLVTASDPGQLELRPGSWDSRTPTDCSGFDQRGLSRPQDDRCEPGAAERAIAPQSGFWWTPARSGQGIDLKRAGDGLLALLYTYDSSGRPITYTAQAEYRSKRWVAPLLRWRQAPVSLLPESTVTGLLQLEFSSATTATVRIEVQGAQVASYPLEVFNFGDPSAVLERTYSGAARYGLSYARHGDTPFALLYAYDADQVLRWASGEASADAGTLKLSSFTGSCPSCPYNPPVARASGLLRLRGIGATLAEADFELRFGVGAGGSLLQESALLERLDTP